MSWGLTSGVRERLSIFLLIVTVAAMVTMMIMSLLIAVVPIVIELKHVLRLKLDFTKIPLFDLSVDGWFSDVAGLIAQKGLRPKATNTKVSKTTSQLPKSSSVLS